MDTKIKNGFSLVELMVVVAVVGVLAGLAVPQYQSNVQKAHRADAKIALITAVTAQEKWFFQHGGYSNNVNNIGGTAGQLLSPEQNYTIAINNLAGVGNCVGGGGVRFNCYTLTATPAAGSTQAKDAQCTSFSLSHTGLRAARGSAAVNCW